ncbi:MAG TPA: SMC-Scp complex subunit ScpB [Candidatus Scatomorpha gallistercoris]|nr:SMC-Scp complex subunit ScpB [Candidatus Scatomorpha gallistercoris]
MDIIELSPALEAVLFASGEPVPVARLSLVFGVPEEDILVTADKLGEYYEKNGRGIRLLRLGGSLQLCSAPEHAKLIARVIEHRAAPKLSPSALEALAVIAYFQPVTRAYVEQVRGVDSSYTVSSLAEKGLIEPAGRLDAPGRPTLYRTTEAFLRVMGISSLDELPTLPDMSEADGLEKLQNAVEELKGRGEQLEMDMG